MKTKPVFDYKKFFVSGDWHFQHAGICYGTSHWPNKSGCRPFKNPAEMTNKLIDNINETVPEDGVLLHLGDFLFGNKNKARELRYRINCQNIIHLFGNHDDWMKNDNDLMDEIFTYTTNYLEFAIQYKDRRQNCVAMHYPIISWRNASKGSWMLHGHCHGNLKLKSGKMIDVGLETNNYYPYSCSQLRSILDPIPIKPVDSHN